MYSRERFHANTTKTGSASSTSTQLTDDQQHVTQPGITAYSGQCTQRTWRNQPDGSHVHHRVHRPGPLERVQQCQYHQGTMAVTSASQTYNPAHVASSLFVGPFSRDDFIEKVSNQLDQHAEYNMNMVSLPTHSETESVFYSVSKPEIQTKDYIRRLVTYTQCSPAAFVVMLIYLDRICLKNTRLLITPYNMHRLLVTALTLACKVLDDRCFSNVHYAKVGGIPSAREMNRLELQFLKYVAYKLHVQEDCYEEKIRSLQNQPPPTSPISVAFEGSPAAMAVSHHERSDTQSMLSSASGTSMSRDVRYRARSETSQYPPVAVSNSGVEKLHNWRSATFPSGNSANGKRLRKDRFSASSVYSSHEKQVSKDVIP